MNNQQLFVLFSDDGDDGIYFCFVGTHEQVNTYIAEMDEEWKQASEDDNVQWDFYWAPLELGVPLPIDSKYDRRIRVRELWV